MTARKRLLTIGHSYCVTLNRRLPQELARAGWDVTAVGPARFRGDFGWHTLEAAPGEPCRVIGLPVHLGRLVHVMLYGRGLEALLAQPWDLVHCWEEPYVAAAAQIARGLGPGVPLVFATFQNIAKRYPPPFDWIERRALRRADGIVAFGRTAAEVLDRRQGDRPPLTAVIPPGVDVDAFRPDERRRAAMLAQLEWSGDVPVVGFLGRLVPEKGIELLMASLDRVAAPWRALVVGTGPLEGAVAAWAGRHGDRVRLLTAARHDAVPGCLNAMDVLCAPSRTTGRWREQFGRMLIEAFASEIAVVASASGEIPHVVGDAALLLEERPVDPAREVGEWQQAIESLVSDRARRLELARRGRQRAESSYAWPVVARQHTEFFDRVIEHCRWRRDASIEEGAPQAAGGRSRPPAFRERGVS
jgi:glycosyltransferase involved in cell wall biosynthesis